MTISEEKAKIRAWAKDLRINIDLKSISKDISKKIFDLKEYQSSKNVMSYLAKDIEVSLNDLFEDRYKNWFLPRMKEKEFEKCRAGESTERSLLAVPFIQGKTTLNKSDFNILEPEIEDDNFFDQINKKTVLDLIFVPGLCFDKSGYRLGFGKGFYDSFLKLNPNSIKIGICPKECLIDKLPTDEWDMKVDLVITE